MEQINFGTVLGVTDKFAIFLDENMVDAYKVDIQTAQQKMSMDSMVGRKIQFNTIDNKVVWAIAEER